jgi:hypothetical protein
MRKLAILAAAGLCAAALPATAHHSGAMFDRAQTITLKGTVKEYQYTNPHSWIEVMVTADGKTIQWGVECEGPGVMRRLGLTPSVLKPGDAVTIRAHPLRDGRPGGSFVDIVLPDGKTIAANQFAPAAPAGAAAPAR